MMQTKLDMRAFQRRADRALEDLALTITDLILMVERCNTDLEHHEHELASLKDRVAYLEAKGEQKR